MGQIDKHVEFVVDIRMQEQVVVALGCSQLSEDDVVYVLGVSELVLDNEYYCSVVLTGRGVGVPDDLRECPGMK